MRFNLEKLIGIIQFILGCLVIIAIFCNAHRIIFGLIFLGFMITFIIKDME